VRVEAVVLTADAVVVGRRVQAPDLAARSKDDAPGGHDLHGSERGVVLALGSDEGRAAAEVLDFICQIALQVRRGVGRVLDLCR